MVRQCWRAMVLGLCAALAWAVIPPGDGGGALGAGSIARPVAVAAARPVPNPAISRSAPAFASDDCAGAYPASRANNGDYGDFWRSCDAPPSAERPVWLAYDLSQVPAARRGKVVVAWYNDPITENYDHTLIGELPYNLPRDYTLETNAAPGGAPPADGWQTRASVTGNSYHSRQHAIDLAGANWLRLRVTAPDGSDRNRDVALNLDVHDVGQGLEDSWVFYGDSITAAGMDHSPRGAGTFAQQIAAAFPDAFPIQEDGGTGNLTSADGARLIDRWLALFPGRYVALGFGTNDANNAAAGDPTVADAFARNLAAMIEATLAAGKVPIVPTIPWARTANIQANAPLLNARIAEFYALYPELVRGPDLWALFRDNQALISADNLHPSDDGYRAYRQQWVKQMLATVYAGAAPTRCFTATGRCVGELFFAYWQAHGGLAINGNPISGVFTETLEDGSRRQVQYFERVRMEYHRQNPAPYTVLLGQFGRLLRPADPPAPAKPSERYFEQTGHNLGGRFLAYWLANGGLAQFGYPLSEEFTETLEDGKPYLVQYFERARFEYHPENPEPFQVLLGQFGRRVLGNR